MRDLEINKKKYNLNPAIMGGHVIEGIDIGKIGYSVSTRVVAVDCCQNSRPWETVKETIVLRASRHIDFKFMCGCTLPSFFNPLNVLKV